MLSLFFFGKTKNKECLLSLTIKDDRAKSTRLTFIWSSNPLLDDPTPLANFENHLFLKICTHVILKGGNVSFHQKNRTWFDIKKKILAVYTLRLGNEKD